MKVNNEYRDASMRVAIRQSAAHPVSEFLGTCMIVVVLWFGGYLIFSGKSPIDASGFIYYLVILYTTLQPIKDLSKAGLFYLYYRFAAFTLPQIRNAPMALMLKDLARINRARPIIIV